jgi:hypothetical protein
VPLIKSWFHQAGRRLLRVICQQEHVQLHEASWTPYQTTTPYRTTTHDHESTYQWSTSEGRASDNPLTTQGCSVGHWPANHMLLLTHLYGCPRLFSPSPIHSALLPPSMIDYRMKATSNIFQCTFRCFNLFLCRENFSLRQIILCSHVANPRF